MSLILFPECLRGWLDYPGHSVLFSRPYEVSLEFSGGTVSPLLLWIPVWHFSSRPTVVSLDTQLAFLFKTSRGVAWILGRSCLTEFPFRHPTGISFIFFWILGRYCLA